MNIRRIFLIVLVVGAGIFCCSREEDIMNGDPTPTPADIQWIKTKGPNSGRVFSLAIDTLTNNIFAGTEGNGVFKSTDKGETWVSFNSGLGGNVVYDLAIDGNNRIYAALSQAGLFRSALDADNWENISPRDTTVWAVAFSPAGPIFAGTSAGFYRSTDDGVNWQAKNNGLTDTTILSLAINSAGHIYAGTFTAGVFKSTDNGENWDPTALIGLTVQTLALNSTDDIFAGMLGGIAGEGLLFSRNGGANWSLPASGFTPSIVYDIAINSDDFVFAGGGGDGVLRSTDNGVSWETKNSGLTSTIIYSLALDKDERLYTGSDSGFVYYTLEPTNIPPDNQGGGQ